MKRGWGTLKLTELLDIEELRALCESFTAFAGTGIAVIDMDGNILIALGWQDICVHYHRIHPVTALRCKESDTVLAAQLEPTQFYNIYKCKNGLVDVSMPITIGGEHIANFFTGQFFFEPPDKEFFARQAEEFGFDKAAYLDALSRVPIFSERKVKTMATFLACLSRMTGEMGFERKELQEANFKLLQQINKQKLTEAELIRSERLYRTLIENIPVTVFRGDHNLRFIYANQAAEKDFGIKNDSIAGKTLSEIGLTAELCQSWEKKFTDVLHSGRATEYESQYPNRDGELRDYFIRVIPETNEAGQIESLLSVSLDITEWKKMEAGLLRLDRLNTVGQMAAAIGHEIRNPLTTVRGYLQLFQSREEYCRHKEQLAMMIEELDRANTIISEYLSLAKTKMTNLENGNLNDVFEALFPLIQADAFHTGHQVKLYAGTLPNIDFDEKEIRQMVLNLVRNGFEAMSGGGTVTITTYQEENHVVFTVRDAGGGIPADVVQHIGTPFLTTKSNGTGLGLSVCYRIAERHNAKIEFTTDEKGATFYVKFPCSNRGGND